MLILAYILFRFFCNGDNLRERKRYLFNILARLSVFAEVSGRNFAKVKFNLNLKHNQRTIKSRYLIILF